MSNPQRAASLAARGCRVQASHVRHNAGLLVECRVRGFVVTLEVLGLEGELLWPLGVCQHLHSQHTLPCLSLGCSGRWSHEIALYTKQRSLQAAPTCLRSLILHCCSDRHGATAGKACRHHCAAREQLEHAAPPRRTVQRLDTGLRSCHKRLG